jgi:alpha-glucosidase
MKKSNHSILQFIFLLLQFYFFLYCSPPNYLEPKLSEFPKEKQWSLYTPDKNGKVDVVLSDLSIHFPFYEKGEQFYYRVQYKDRPLLEWSPLGIDYGREGFYSGLTLVSLKEKNSEESYLLAHGKKSSIKVPYNEFTFSLKNVNDKGIEFVFRLQNDGAAFQYRIPYREAIPSSGQIHREYSGFRFPQNTTGFMQEYQEASKVSPAYEYYYTGVRAGEKDSGKASIRSIFQPIVNFTGLVIFGSDGWAFPALFETPDKDYVLLTESGLTSQYAGTHLQVDSKSGLYTIDFPAEKEGQGVGDRVPFVSLPFRSTWKVIGFGGLKQIIESTIVTDLSDPLHPMFNGKIPEWIRSGKSSWDWWSYLETGNLERQKKYTDAASEFGWEYVLVDANWNKWNGGKPEQEIKELVKYASDKKVNIILWYNSGGPTNSVLEEPRDLLHERDVRRTEFSKLKEWGIKGLKIDFWQSDKQSSIQQYLSVLQDAAEFGLLVNFHGATIPRGWERQFPNLMTMEAVKGAEWFRFPVFRGPNSSDHVYYAFTRNVIGPMDYTPVVFEAAYDQQKIGYAHSLALSVLFESAIQHFADNSDKLDTGYRLVFSKFPFVKEFIKEVPTAWEETLFLSGHPSSHIILARKKGNSWYIAGISSETKKLSIPINLSFMGEGNHDGILISEEKTGDKLQITSLSLSSADPYTINFLPHGGFVIKVNL